MAFVKKEMQAISTLFTVPQEWLSVFSLVNVYDIVWVYNPVQPQKEYEEQDRLKELCWPDLLPVHWK